MATPVTIFTGSSGLNVKVDPTRIRFDPKTGVTDLAVAYNVEHDQTGRISRRKGQEVTAITVACHSLFCEGGEALMVTGTSLCIVAPDLSGYEAIATVTQGATVEYAQVDTAIFWMNGFEKGFVREGSNYAWVKGTYYGPNSDRVLSDPPIGTIVRAFSGHMYVAQGKVLWYSDPYDLNAFDLGRNFFSFEGSIQMVRPVTSGIYVGTDQGVWFLVGNSPATAQIIKKTDSPAIKGTDIKVDLTTIGFENLLQGNQGEGVMWTSPAGIYLGTAEGLVFNLTKDKLSERSAVKGASHVFNDNYVVLLSP
jgi:hypothetical protein